jgi:hypothetical protein
MSGCTAPELEGGDDEMTRPQVRLNIRPNQPGSDSLPNTDNKGTYQKDFKPIRL